MLNVGAVARGSFIATSLAIATFQARERVAGPTVNELFSCSALPWSILREEAQSNGQVQGWFR
ncbi:MAG: hypothetical protein B7Z22_03920 [Hyphomonas sp. 32-62-5]|nr:MAG: hypothetical protein B7Z22_03920 [Hyphomonas sp. 32-62-5]